LHLASLEADEKGSSLHEATKQSNVIFGGDRSGRNKEELGEGEGIGKEGYFKRIRGFVGDD
jgi:hypothetical protein